MFGLAVSEYRERNDTWDHRLWPLTWEYLPLLIGLVGLPVLTIMVLRKYDVELIMSLLLLVNLIVGMAAIGVVLLAVLQYSGLRV